MAVLTALTKLDSERDGPDAQWRGVGLYAARVEELMRGEPQAMMAPSGGPSVFGGFGSSGSRGMLAALFRPTDDRQMTEKRRHCVRDIYEEGRRELAPLYAEQNGRIVEALALLLAASQLSISAISG